MNLTKRCLNTADGPSTGRYPKRSRMPIDDAVEDKLVERINLLSPVDFFNKYHPETAVGELCSKCRKLDAGICVVFSRPSDMGKDVLEGCFKLIEASSADDYKGSELKWSPNKKRKEMKLPDLRYLVMFEAPLSCEKSHHNSIGMSNLNSKLSSQAVAGFTSFMVTYEDGLEVVYVYEVHLASKWQSRGLGRLLMRIIEGFGTDVGVGKIMLTVFKANNRALKWYQSLGYGEDEYSPAPRVLRNGIVKEPGYLILSKRLENTRKQDDALRADKID